MSLDVSLIDEDGNCLFSSNITHNLCDMAMAAGVYKCCWRPKDIGAKKAKDITKYLRDGISDMENRPDFFKRFDSPNGWGRYKHFLPWLEEYYMACQKYPDAEIDVSI